MVVNYRLPLGRSFRLSNVTKNLRRLKTPAVAAVGFAVKGVNALKQTFYGPRSEYSNDPSVFTVEVDRPSSNATAVIKAALANCHVEVAPDTVPAATDDGNIMCSGVVTIWAKGLYNGDAYHCIWEQLKERCPELVMVVPQPSPSPSAIDDDSQGESLMETAGFQVSLLMLAGVGVIALCCVGLHCCDSLCQSKSSQQDSNNDDADSVATAPPPYEPPGYVPREGAESPDLEMGGALPGKEIVYAAPEVRAHYSPATTLKK